jgi:hypothetical protein
VHRCPPCYLLWALDPWTKPPSTPRLCLCCCKRSTEYKLEAATQHNVSTWLGILCASRSLTSIGSGMHSLDENYNSQPP